MIDMKKVELYLIIAALTALFSAACSLSAYDGGQTDITIDLEEIGNRTPAAALTWLSLDITGDGMESVNYDQTELSLLLEINNGIITVPVTSGPSRTFTLVGETDSVEFTGTTTVDIDSGTAPVIVLTMQVSGLDILVPDRGYGRIVKLDDITGTGRINSTSIVDLAVLGFQLGNNVEVDSNGNIFAGVYTQDPGIAIFKTPTVDALDTSWTQVLTYSAGSLRFFKLRLDDNVIFTVHNYGNDVMTPYVPDGLGRYITAGTDADLTYTDSLELTWPVGSLFGVDVLDNGQIAVIGQYYSSPDYVAVVFVLDYDSATDTWTTVASLGSDTNANLSDMLLFGDDPVLTHKGNSIYYCGTPDAGNPELHEIVYDPAGLTLTYDTDDTLVYEAAAYQILGVVPTLDDSVIFTAYDSTTPEYLIISFNSAADFGGEAVSYNGGAAPFDFADIPY